MLHAGAETAGIMPYRRRLVLTIIFDFLPNPRDFRFVVYGVRASVERARDISTAIGPEPIRASNVLGRDIVLRSRSPMSLSFLSEHGLSQLVAAYGYWVVAAVVGLESMGLPLPGETMLIIAAVYAGTTHQLDISLVIAAAAAGAILGDNIGFWIGREIGHRLLIRFGPSIGLNERRLKLGQFLFLRYGAEAVFLGRFVAVLRALAALLAGANGMAWPRFLVANALGGIVWASLYGLGAYLFGNEIHRLSKSAGTALLILALLAVAVGVVFIRRNEARLEDEAERALPGPLLSRRPK